MSKGWQLPGLCLLLLLCSGLPANTVAQAPIHLIQEIETAELDAGSYAEPPVHLDAHQMPSAWQHTSLPDILPRTLLFTDSAAVASRWYRVRLTEFAAQTTQQLALYLPRWQTIGKISVYADRQLIYHSPTGPVWNGFNHPLLLNLQSAGETMPQELILRLDFQRSAGLALSAIRLGERSALETPYRWRHWWQVELIQLSSALFLVIGCFSLAVWLKRRHESIYALFFAASLFSYLRARPYFKGLDPLPIPEQWFTWININALGLLAITTYFYCFRLHQRRFPRLEYSLLTLLGLSGILSLPPLTSNISLHPSLPSLLLLLLTLVLSAAMLFASWHSKNRDALLVSGYTLLSIPTAAHDVLLQNYLVNIEGYYLLPYLTVGTFVLFMYITLRRYLQAIEDVEQANLRLSSALAQRERELTASHERLRHIEHQQMLSKERQRLMRDMHDGLGSSLISALAATERGQVSQAEVSDMLRDCIDDLKLTIDSLEPAVTDLGMLLGNLRYRLEPRLRQAGITLHWHINTSPDLDWLNPENALHILRILQEVFSNLIKHSSCSEISLSIEQEQHNLSLVVCDNGMEFNGNDKHKVGSCKGLYNLHHRADRLHGRVTWRREGQHNHFRLLLPTSLPDSKPTTTPQLQVAP